MRFALALLLLLSVSPALDAAKTLDIYFVDVEGGQATLLVTPSGQSMLIDTGFPGRNGRDAGRIAAAAKAAGVDKLDYLLITHYHGDHVGAVNEVIAKLPVKTFIDHGDNRETGRGADELNAEYKKALATGKRLTVKPGDKLPLKGVDIQVLTADGNRIDKSLKGAGQSNALCSGAKYPDDPTENARSVGMLITFGKFRMLDLGDLTQAKEVDLVCPENRVGTVDLYLTTHHGMNSSNAKEIVHAVKPRVAIMNNGPRKGGSPDAYNVIRSAPGLEDLWQLHFAMAGGKEANAPDPFIANLEATCEGKPIKVSVNSNGSFTVHNTRNQYEKTYAAK